MCKKGTSHPLDEKCEVPSYEFNSKYEFNSIQ